MTGQIRGAPLSYGHYAAITPDNATNFSDGECSGIYVGGGGVVPVVRPDGTAVNFTAVAGEIIPVEAIRVNTTNLTASLLVALYRRKP